MHSGAFKNFRLVILKVFLKFEASYNKGLRVTAFRSNFGWTKMCVVGSNPAETMIFFFRYFSILIIFSILKITMGNKINDYLKKLNTV